MQAACPKGWTWDVYRVGQPDAQLVCIRESDHGTWYVLPYPVLASDGTAIPPPTTVPTRIYRQEQAEPTHYRCYQVGGFTFMEPIDNLNAKTQAFTCVNCECKGEK